MFSRTLSAVLVAVAPSVLAAGPVYDLNCLDCALGFPLLPVGLNDAGVVVATDDVGCNFPEGCYRSAQGYVIDHGTITATPSFGDNGKGSDVLAINNHGLVAGNAFMAELPTGPFGYSWDGVTMVDLGDTLDHDEGFYFSYATSVNDSGILVGMASTGNSQDATAFLYKNGLMTAIPPLADSIMQLGLGIVRINNRSHIIGTAYYQSTFHYAWISKGGRTTALAPSTDWSEAYSLNDVDQVAGAVRVQNGQNDYNDYAAIWTKRKTKLLNTLPGYSDHGQANAINNSGWAVGDACGPSTCTAFVFTGKKLFDLNTRLSGSGTGWTMLHATAINASGVIAGYAVTNDADHIQHAVMLTPRR